MPLQANIRFIALQSLTKEDYFISNFQYALYKPKQNIWRWGPLISITVALNNLITFGVMAYGYFIGLTFMKKDLDFTSNPYKFGDGITDKYIKLQKIWFCI